MISLQIDDIKHFMNRLLKDNIFDEFEVVSMELQTGTKIHIDGRLNLSYFSEIELEEYRQQEFIRWGELKNTLLSLIKGNKPPISMKIVLIVSKSSTLSMIERSNLPFKLEDVNGFYINIHYEHNLLTLITGTSFKLFTLDKSLEKHFDETICKFLSRHEIAATIC